MKTKIEVAKTYWVGMTPEQSTELGLFFNALQSRDVAEIVKRVSGGLTPKGHEEIWETVEALKHAIQNQ